MLISCHVWNGIDLKVQATKMLMGLKVDWDGLLLWISKVGGLLLPDGGRLLGEQQKDVGW